MNETAGRAWRVYLPLLLLATVCGALLVATARWTEEGIADSRQRASLRVIRAIIPQPHDNDPLQDMRELDGSQLADDDATVTVHVARQGGSVQGYVFRPVTVNGYEGLIRLAVGIRCDGTVSGVRVIEQSETDGLGSAVDQRESDWILQFRGLSLEKVPPPAWTVATEGGAFDGLSGATITSRAVINGIRRVLGYYATSELNCCREGEAC